MRSNHRLLGIGLGMIVACNTSDLGPGNPENAGPPIETDASVYRLARIPGGYSAVAVATYRNSTGRPVFYQRCFMESVEPLYGVRRTGSDSTASTVVGPGWGCVGGVPTGRVVPNQSLTITVNLSSYDSPNAQPPVTPAERIGRYRVEFMLCADFEEESGACRLLPQAERESNAFDLLAPEE